MVRIPNTAIVSNTADILQNVLVVTSPQYYSTRLPLGLRALLMGGRIPQIISPKMILILILVIVHRPISWFFVDFL